MYYIVRKLSRSERVIIERLIGDIYVRVNSTGKKMRDDMIRDDIIKKTKAKFLKISPTIKENISDF